MARGIKTGGRKAGTPNRLTKELRIILKNIMYQEIDCLLDQFANLELKDRLKLLIKLFPYVLPKINSVSYIENEPSIFNWDD